MEFIIEDIYLKRVIKKASNLLTKIEKEDLPNSKIATKLDLEYKDTLTKMKRISPILAITYVTMYNYIQKDKIKEGDTYCKRLRDKYEP